MKKIPLTQGKFALVDDEDFEKLSQYKWSAWENRRNWYAKRTLITEETQSKRTTILMHRLLMNFPDSEIDHFDGDGLNNQKLNLRLATSGQNNQNQRRSVANSSGYKGVSWLDRCKKWVAQIQHNGNCIYLGLHHTKKEAAKAYDAKARELFGEYARLNFTP